MACNTSVLVALPALMSAMRSWKKLISPKDLVRYTTEHSLKGGVTHLIRPRIMVYAAVIVNHYLAR